MLWGTVNLVKSEISKDVIAITLLSLCFVGILGDTSEPVF